MWFATVLRNRYVITVLASLAALLGMQILYPICQEPAQPPLFLLAVLFAASYGGVRAGLLATLLGLAGNLYLSHEPLLSLADARLDEQLRLGWPGLVGVLSSLAIARPQRAERRAWQAAAHKQGQLQEALAKRAKTEQALRECEHFAYKLVLSSLNGLYIFNPNSGKCGFINPEYTRLTGYALADLEAVGEQGFFALFHPEDVDRVAAHFKILMRMDGDESLEIEYRFRRADGQWIWCLSRNTVYAREADGSVREILGAFFDITQRKLGESATAYERSLLDALQMTAPVGLGFIDRSFRFVRVNETLAALNGIPVAAHLGHSVAEVLPVIWPRLEWVFRQVVESGEPLLNVEISGESDAGQGDVRHWLCNFYPVRLDREIVGIGAVVMETTQGKRAEAEIRQLNADLARRVVQLRTLIDLAPVGLMITEDPELRTLRMNKTLVGMIGLSQDINASLGVPPEQRPPWKILRRGEVVPLEQLPIWQAMAGGQPVVADDLDWAFDNGRVFRIAIYATPLLDEQGRVWGGIGAVVDIGERVALRQQTARLQAVNLRKDEFLATLAHELRNPLAPIRNAVYVLNRPAVSEQTVCWARDIINRQVEHIAHLVNDLLDVSRITCGKIALDKRPVAIETILARAVEACAISVEARHHRLYIAPSPAGAWVEGDEVRLAQVVINLLDNAVKYSPEGSRIWLASELREGWVLLRIKDEGLGIARDFLPEIFEIFAQSDRSLNRAQGGLGIGLALVKSLVELHGGRVEATSEGEGRGSEFVVWLPHYIDKGATPPKPPHLKILLVGDHEKSADDWQAA